MNFKRIFEFWNTEFTDENDSQWIGTCPFCGKIKHFYLNKDSGLWTCFICSQKGGNVYTFLNKFYDELLEKKDDVLLRSLARLKYVSYLKLKEWGIVPIDKHEYVIPYFNENGKICNLKRYPLGKKGLFTPELKAGIYGIQQLFDPVKKGWPVFVVEAEFNAITLDWYFQKLGFNAICVAIHGTYRKDVLEYLQGWQVYFCLDNDLEAREASIKLCEKLKATCTKLNILMWPEDFSKGYDVRDFIKDYVIIPKDFEGAKAKLFSFFREIKSDNLGDVSIKNIPVCTYEELLDTFSKTVQLSPNFTDAFKLALATIVSMQVPSKRPVWLFLCGPPGCGKSTICAAFRLASNQTIFQSSIHAKALVSGWAGRSGVDPSLIPRLNKKTLVLQDFTEVLAKSMGEKAEIFSILRGVYDGHLQRAFGQGTIREYYSSFAIVSGVTRAIYAENTAGLGERFIRFNMYSSKQESQDQQKIALERDLEGDDCDLNVQKKVIGFLENKYDTSIGRLREMVPEWFKVRLQALTTLVAILRTPVERYIFGRLQHEVIYNPDVESGNRLAVQFQRLAVSLALVEQKEEVDIEIYRLLSTIGKNSLDDFRYMLVKELYKHDMPVVLSKFNFGPALNSRVCIKYLQDLEVINVVTSQTIALQGRNEVAFSLHDNIRNLMNEANFGTG